MHTRFAKFVNLPELLSMFRTFADVQTADMLKLPAPDVEGGKPHVVAAPASPELKNYVADAGGARPGPAERRRRPARRQHAEDYRRRQEGRARHAPGGLEMPETTCETKISRGHRQDLPDLGEARRTSARPSLSSATSRRRNPDRFNVYDDIRDRLIAQGHPAKEIAYIHDADTDAQKKTLFDAVNAGRVRILLGSTEKMGAGTNVQKRLKALHHLDAPWRPRDIEQREGRILRQGNDNPQVDIYRYVTEGSFDAYMWQTLETKARFIQQVMNGSVTVRQAEDLEGGALTYAEIKAIASGNPAVMEKVKVDTEIRKLDQLRASHVNQQHNIRWQVKNLPDHIRQLEGNRRAHRD